MEQQRLSKRNIQISAKPTAKDKMEDRHNKKTAKTVYCVTHIV